MTEAERTKRATKAQSLQVSPQEDDIHHDANGSLLAVRWLVTCESDPALRHQVRYESSPAPRWSCSCQDYRQHREEQPTWTCKHIIAAQAQAPTQETPATKAPIGFTAQLSPKERIELEAQAMFGDTAAIAILNGKPAQDPRMEAVSSISIPRTTVALCTECGSPIDQEDLKQFSAKSQICGGCLHKAQLEALNAPAGPTDPCSLCGQLLRASEMLPWDGADGSGLICQECHGEIEPTVEAMEAIETDQAERKAVPTVPTLAERIAQVNEILASFGAVAIETDQKGYTGYSAQYVMDAVNQALGFDGWRYDLVSHQVEKSGEKAHRAMVLLQLSIRMDDGSWFCRGPVVGGGTNGDGPDALKGAITDGLKKAFSQWSIGNRAYRGELSASTKAGR